MNLYKVTKCILFVLVSIIALFFQSCKPQGQQIKDLPKREFFGKLHADLPLGTPKDEVLRYLQLNEIDCVDNSPISINLDEEFVTCVVTQESLVYSNYRIGAEFYFDKQTRQLVRIHVVE